jgi:hypothetical protein
VQETNPDLFIADVDIEFVLLLSNGRKPVERIKLRQSTTKLAMTQIPILLKDGKIPTERQKRKLFLKFHTKFKIKENISRLELTSINIKNIKFSSKIQWKFNYETD